MAIGTQAPAPSGSPAALDASKLIVNLASELKPVPDADSLIFGETKTDHMLVVNYNPISGWEAPEIKPYAPLTIDPMASCLQYCTNVFEGMKAYVGPDGHTRLFRPKENMARLVRSAGRVALPTFDPDAVLELILRLVEVEKRWIPKQPGTSLYIRPTIVGTREALGVGASDHAILYIIVSPTGPYFKGIVKGISLLGVGETVRSWPGGTGGFKLGLNYAPTFLPQRVAAKQGYDQILWLLGDNDQITECGAMNFFVAVQREDGDGVDLITPALDGTILPGVTRASTLLLAQAHTSGKITLPGVPAGLKIHAQERRLTMAEVAEFSDAGRLLESFCVGTAVLVAPIGRIGWKGRDLVVPEQEGGLGPIGKGMHSLLADIQTGKVEYDDWSLVVA